MSSCPLELWPKEDRLTPNTIATNAERGCELGTATVLHERLENIGLRSFSASMNLDAIQNEVGCIRGSGGFASRVQFGWSCWYKKKSTRRKSIHGPNRAVFNCVASFSVQPCFSKDWQQRRGLRSISKLVHVLSPKSSSPGSSHLMFVLLVG